MKRILLAAALAMPFLTHADGILSSVADGVEAAADSVVAPVKSLTDKRTPEQKRNDIDAMARKTLDRLFSKSADAKALYEKSVAYAVFDNRKTSMGFTTGGGVGVVVDKASGKPVYMRMATAGVNVGLGTQFYQVVILFATEATYKAFLQGEFSAGADMKGTLGKQSEGSSIRFVDGLAAFQLTDRGLGLAADLTGTKYWQDDSLNGTATLGNPSAKSSPN